MTCTGSKKTKIHSKCEMKESGNTYILKGNEYQTYICPECGEERLKVIK